MNYPQTIETLKRLGVEFYDTHTKRIMDKEIPDGISFYWPSIFLRDKADQLRWALPDCRVTFNPNTQRIRIEDF